MSHECTISGKHIVSKTAKQSTLFYIGKQSMLFNEEIMLKHGKY